MLGEINLAYAGAHPASNLVYRHLLDYVQVKHLILLSTDLSFDALGGGVQ